MSDPRERYFDNAATSPLDPRVREAMLPWMEDQFGNANSIHSLGLRARDAVERARAQVAAAIGAEDPSEIVFTSGATEANNWLLSAHPGAWVSPIEHSSIWEQVGPRGLLTGVVIPSAGLVSMMAVNNETGAIYSTPEESAGRQVHVDATQAVGKMPFDVGGADFVSFSAHKFHGPKGVGVLYARDADFPAPFLMGGEQEAGHRAGTLNVPAIVGMGEAIGLSLDRDEAELASRAVLESLAGVSDWHRNGASLPFVARDGSFPPGVGVAPFILSLSFLGLEGETIVIELDRRGFAISSGAACSSRSAEPSHVLTAMGYPAEWLRGTIRISFGRFNTVEAARDLGVALREIVEGLRNLA